MAMNIKQKLIKLLKQLESGEKNTLNNIVDRIKQKDIIYPNNDKGIDAAIVTVATIFENNAALRSSANKLVLTEFYKSVAPTNSNDPESEEKASFRPSSRKE